MADFTEPCSRFADSADDFSAEASSLLKRRKTEGVNALWVLERSTKGVEVVMEREENAVCEEAARKAARRMRCLCFLVSMEIN
jgi:hypothetical protein